MSRAERRQSAPDEAGIALIKAQPIPSDDRAFTKYQLDKIASKENLQHTCLAWLTDGSALLVGTSDGGIQAFSYGKNTVTWAVDASQSSVVSHIAANPQRPSLFTAAFRDPKRPEDSTLRSYDTRSRPNPNAKVYTRTHGDLLAMAYHPDGTRLLAVQRSGKLMLFDMRKTMRKEGGPAVPLRERTVDCDINDVQFSPDGKAIIAAYGVTVGGAVGGSVLGGLCILNAEDLSDVAEHRGHVTPAISLAQATRGDGRHVVALGGNDGTATLWDTGSMAVVRPLHQSERPVRRVGLSGDGSMLAITGSREHKGMNDGVDIAVFDPQDIFAPPRIHRMELGPMLLKDMSWSPKAPALAICGDVLDGYQRSTKDSGLISTVWLYRPRPH